jgi:hypothetical protein
MFNFYSDFRYCFQLILVNGMKPMSKSTWMAMAQGEVKPVTKILAKLVCLSALAPYTYPE